MPHMRIDPVSARRTVHAVTAFLVLLGAGPLLLALADAERGLPLWLAIAWTLACVASAVGLLLRSRPARWVARLLLAVPGVLGVLGLAFGLVLYLLQPLPLSEPLLEVAHLLALGGMLLCYWWLTGPAAEPWFAARAASPR